MISPQRHQPSLKLWRGTQRAQRFIFFRLKSTGALILGKTVTVEFANYSPGPTRNPHNPEHTPGGSSSGSAAAVAAGLCPLALGTQTVGSVIRPAAYCGVVGVKPTYGRISVDGVIPLAPAATGAAPKGLDYTGDWIVNLLWTHAGLPVVTLPSGFSEENLPFGLQVVGRWMKDERLLNVAKNLAALLKS